MTNKDALKRRYKILAAASSPPKFILWYDDIPCPAHNQNDIIVRLSREYRKL